MGEKDGYSPWFVAAMATCLKRVGGSVCVYVCMYSWASKVTGASV